VQTTFERLCDEFGQKTVDIEGWLDYVKSTYIVPTDGTTVFFPFEVWSHGTTEGERTNNRVEGDNGRMKMFCKSAHPDINTAVNQIEKNLTTTIDKFNNGLTESAVRKSRNNKDVARETARRIHKRYFDDGFTTVRQYMSMIGDLFEFNPKKATRLQNEDTESEEEGEEIGEEEDIIDYIENSDDSDDEDDDDNDDEDDDDNDDEDDDDNDDEDDDENQLQIAMGMERLLQQAPPTPLTTNSSQAQREECQNCKKLITLNKKDGKMRKHQCN
jgi:hypothetical protein